MEATIRHEQSFVAAKDSISKTDKNYNEAVMKSRATTLAFGSTNKRGAGLATPITDLESYTPVTGPLKKRLKYRYSLGSNYSLFTPSGFYSLTPDFASCKKDMKSLTARNDIRVPRIRTPLSDISTPNAANFRHGSDQILKKPAPKFLSPKKENRKKPDHAVHVRSLAASALVQRKQKLRNLFQMSKPSRSYIPPTAKSTPILLPHSPIATKASNGIHQSSGRNTDSLEDYYTKSYMCFIRNQYEFFELSSDDVALCKDRNVSVEEGQVAMRCRHCTCIDLSFRPKGSLAVAKKHETLYKHFYDRKSSHVEELCPFVPKITRKQLVALRYQDSTFGRTPFGQDFAYWCAKAKALGVVETPKGLRFKTSLLLQAKTDRFSMSRNIAENFQNMEHSKAVASPPYEQCRLLQDQRSGAVEHPHVSWGKTFASDNPKSTIGNLSSKVDMEECDGLNDSDMEECDGLKCSVEQAQEAQTWRQKASESNWHNRLREFIDFKYRNGHGKLQETWEEFRDEYWYHLSHFPIF